jgi:hypothetical protein
MTQLTFGYSDSEDRIWLSVSTGQRFWLTRRMLLGFLPKIAELLQKTVPGGDIPHALPAAERVALEHAEALEDNLDGQPAMTLNKETRTTSLGSGKVPPPPQLLTSLSASAKGDHCTLILRADDPEGGMKLKRIEFHRILAALVRTARNAGWDLRGIPNWLNPPVNTPPA